jgi:hypothetical protein
MGFLAQRQLRFRIPFTTVHYILVQRLQRRGFAPKVAPAPALGFALVLRIEEEPVQPRPPLCGFLSTFDGRAGVR